MEPLQTERDFFARSVDQWVKLHPGKFALVKGEELVGVFDSDVTAVVEGARRFGDQPFLVRRIALDEQAPSVPAYTLAACR